MNNKRSIFNTKTNTHLPYFQLAMPIALQPKNLKPLFAVAALTIILGLQCTPLSAQEASKVAQRNAVSSSQAEIALISGGIGDESRDEMRKNAAAYNVHIVFSDRQGSYLANIPFSVTRRNGQKIYSGLSEGPLLYLQLSPGSYQIAAEIDGVWQSKRVQAGSSGSSARMVFVSR